MYHWNLHTELLIAEKEDAYSTIKAPLVGVFYSVAQVNDDMESPKHSVVPALDEKDTNFARSELAHMAR